MRISIVSIVDFFFNKRIRKLENIYFIIIYEFEKIKNSLAVAEGVKKNLTIIINKI